MKSISQLSKEAGIPIHTIRYYIKLGLIKGRKKRHVKSNNYTWYSNSVLERISLILEAKQNGFPLSKINPWLNAKQKLSAAERKKRAAELRMEKTQTKIAEVNSKMKKLEEWMKFYKSLYTDLSIN